MDVAHERRDGKDRREFAIYYRYGCEHRNNTGNRRLDTVKKLQSYLTGSELLTHSRGSDKSFEIVEEIAEAFGVQPRILEMLEHDDLAGSAEECQACEDHARMNAELRTELAESRRKIERYRK